MQNFLFYTATVLIWGSTWIAIKFQLGAVDPMLSVGYRFSLAAALLLLWCMVRRLPMRFSLGEHGFMALQGIFLFSLNYLLFYLAELQLTSGLAAVIFSTILLMNMVNGAIFLRSPLDKKVFVGSFFGLFGIILVFRPEIASFSLDHEGLRGIILCLLATFSASLGNILSARNQKNRLPIIQTNAFGMGYGALLMLIVAWITGKPFTIETTTLYISSLLYLAVFGSPSAAIFLSSAASARIGRPTPLFSFPWLPWLFPPSGKDTAGPVQQWRVWSSSSPAIFSCCNAAKEPDTLTMKSLSGAASSTSKRHTDTWIPKHSRTPEKFVFKRHSLFYTPSLMKEITSPALLTASQMLASAAVNAAWTWAAGA